MKRFIYALTAIVLVMSNVCVFGTDIPEKTGQNQLIEDMILYYGCYGEAADVEIDGLLGALKKPISARESFGRRSWITGDMSIQAW